MKIYDISLTVFPNMPVWPGDPPVLMERVEKIENGDLANVTKIVTGVHVGTHIDAPYHFLGGETKTIEQIPLSVLAGRATVIQVPDEVNLITAEVLKNLAIPARIRRLLLKTRNSERWADQKNTFWEDFVALSGDGAEYLVRKHLQLVGIDAPSIAPMSDLITPHRLLLEAGIIIVEGLNLAEISAGRYMLYCLPWKLSGSDGAPARAILVGV
jgi:arylformamidase